MRIRVVLKSRPGATLAVVAVSLVALLAAMALAIDLGMMYSARNEAQRAADAAALAGASAFIDQPNAVLTFAPDRANEYATSNAILGRAITTAETNVEVNTMDNRVRVTVTRRQIPTWFARFVGVDTVTVSATAVAEAVDAGAARCVRPWAVQDLWHEMPADVRPAEADKFDPAVDRYEPAVTQPQPGATGYGATDADHGRQIVLKTQRPVTGNQDTELYQPGPGEFMIWEMPNDPNLESCSQGGNASSPSYQYRNSICGCNNNQIQIGQEYGSYKPGNVVGPTDQGLSGLIAKDPTAYWDNTTKTVVSPQGAASPRIVKMGLIKPLGPPPGGNNWNQSNMPPVVFSNFAMMFVEGYDIIGQGNNRQVAINARFLYYASGEQGPNTGSLVKYLRLVR